MRQFRPTRSYLSICCAALLLASGCGSSPSGPLDPALTGNWVIPGVDTWVQFSLEQRGSKVTGIFGYYSPVSSPDVHLVSGTATLPHVVLMWTEEHSPQTFDATLSSDQQSLTGTLNGGSVSLTFHRQPPISGRML